MPKTFAILAAVAALGGAHTVGAHRVCAHRVRAHRVRVQTVQSAETKIVTLSCGGAGTIGNGKSQPIGKTGVVVNLAEDRVAFVGYVVPITQADVATITFKGRTKDPEFGLLVSVTGSIDRVTGEMEAKTTFLGDRSATPNSWALRCKPATRMF